MTKIAARSERSAVTAYREARQERSPWRPYLWPVAAGAAVVIGVVATLAVIRTGEQRQSPRTRLAQASARNGRILEGRLADFPWSRLGAARGSEKDADLGQTMLRGEAAKVAAMLEGDNSQESRHASGVSQLLIGNAEKAADDLERAARGSLDPRLWNDLAVARDAAAMLGEQSRYPEALAAADRALRLRPRFPEAVFNRALILERLGFIERAIAQWQAYLTIDPSSPWAAEANGHLRNLQQALKGIDFNAALGRASAAFAAGNAAPLDDLVRAWPQDARSWGEGPLLAQWATAIQRNDGAGAQRLLGLVRRMAEQLAARNGERLLFDAVAAIDAARSDPARLRLLSDGHARYDSGRRLGNARPAAAEADLKEAAARFGRGGSPMAQVATYYAATTIFEQNRMGEAHAILLDLAARCDGDRHRALYALEASQLARCNAFAGEWTAALQNTLRSTATFASMGESANAAFVRASVAGAYDHIGDAGRAWALWISSMNGLRSGRELQRRRAVVANAIRSCIRNRAYDGASALAQAAIEDLRGTRDTLLLSDALIQRARAAAENGDDAAAMIAEAREAAAALSDAAQRARAEADLTIVQGVAARRADPAASIALLSQAIDFYRDRQYRPWLIEALFQRGRSYAAASQPSNALEDFRRAIDGMEQQRTTIADAAGRERFFDIEPGLFEETTALQLRQGDLTGAFATADRFRARALREQMGVTPPAALPSPRNVQNALRPGTAILEYAFVPSGLVVFCLTRESLTAERVALDRAALRGLIADFRAAIEREEDVGRVKALGRQLHDVLIAPINTSLTGITEVIFIADRDIQSVPFGALVDGATGGYVIEQRAMSLAPSASLAARRSARPSSKGRALFVGNPTVPERDPLPAAELEATALGRMSSDAVVLTRHQATKRRFIEEAQKARRIHYAGHTRAEGPGLAALLLATDSGNEGALDAGEIARLRLSATELVVIAACSSARGETRLMEGVPSLSRAFMIAGAPTVVATLWDIDDALTSPLFMTFHRGIAAGESPARALQQAQIAALHSSDAMERHPSTWGGIVVVGHTGGVTNDSNSQFR